MDINEYMRDCILMYREMIDCAEETNQKFRLIADKLDAMPEEIAKQLINALYTARREGFL